MVSCPNHWNGVNGFGTNAGVIVLAATNRADILDKALLRAGRFDRQINVELPDLKERREIFDVHLKNLKLDPHLDRDFLAKQTPGFSGADIANVCNEAALIAARNNKKQVEKEDFLSAIDRIIGGLERKNKIIIQKNQVVGVTDQAINAAFDAAKHNACGRGEKDDMPHDGLYGIGCKGLKGAAHCGRIVRDAAAHDGFDEVMRAPAAHDGIKSQHQCAGGY